MRRRQNTDIILAIEYDTTNIEVENVITSLTTAVPHVYFHLYHNTYYKICTLVFCSFMFLLYCQTLDSIIRKKC